MIKQISDCLCWSERKHLQLCFGRSDVLDPIIDSPSSRENGRMQICLLSHWVRLYFVRLEASSRIYLRQIYVTYHSHLPCGIAVVLPHFPVRDPLRIGIGPRKGHFCIPIRPFGTSWSYILVQPSQILPE